MIFEVFGDTLELIGTLLIAYAVLAVHQIIKHERKLDSAVYKELSLERTLVVTGMILITVGFIMRTYGKHFS